MSEIVGLTSDERSPLPVFSVNRQNLLAKLLKKTEGKYGILANQFESDNLLNEIRRSTQVFFLDAGVFRKKISNYQQANCLWYQSLEFPPNVTRGFKVVLADLPNLSEKIKGYLDSCERFSPDYVFAPDVYGEPLISLHLARIAWEEYSRRPRCYELIGVVQAGHALFNWPESPPLSSKELIFSHYSSPKSFLLSLFSEYRNIGFQKVAIGGLLKADKTMPTGLRFGLSNEKLDDLLSWSRADFVLGGFALTRLEILKKHKVWADSTNWLWWDARYDYERFGDCNAFQRVFQKDSV